MVERGGNVSTDSHMESTMGKRGFAVMEGDPIADACLVDRPATQNEQGEHLSTLFRLVLLEHHVRIAPGPYRVLRYHKRLHIPSFEFPDWFSQERTGCTRPAMRLEYRPLQDLHDEIVPR